MGGENPVSLLSRALWRLRADGICSREQVGRPRVRSPSPPRQGRHRVVACVRSRESEAIVAYWISTRGRPRARRDGFSRGGRACGHRSSFDTVSSECGRLRENSEELVARWGFKQLAWVRRRPVSVCTPGPRPRGQAHPGGTGARSTCEPDRSRTSLSGFPPDRLAKTARPRHGVAVLIVGNARIDVKLAGQSACARVRVLLRVRLRGSRAHPPRRISWPQRRHPSRSPRARASTLPRPKRHPPRQAHARPAAGRQRRKRAQAQRTILRWQR